MHEGRLGQSWVSLSAVIASGIRYVRRWRYEGRNISPKRKNTEITRIVAEQLRG